ncbi:MAG: fused MFS/spermidine synthase [Lachnospiraceae bacterium]|nr:fused MFS/spermidine synthase [Lachnospiraceae bacterium]
MYYDYAMAAPYMAGIHEGGSDFGSAGETMVDTDNGSDSIVTNSDASRAGEALVDNYNGGSDSSVINNDESGAKEASEFNILVLGNGTGTYATQCKRYFQNVNIEGVEIDEKITALAEKYFDLPEDVNVTTYDGRAYLNASDKTYDVIMVDAYQDITIPFQMSTLEFFDLVNKHLKKDGVMIVNMNMRSGDDGSINEYLSDTIYKIFKNVYTVDVPGSTNKELFASNNPDFIERLDINNARETDLSLKALISNIKASLVKYEPSGELSLLTDDKAPVELLGMKVIDEIIKNETEYYKNIYEEKGLSGLMDELG